MAELTRRSILRTATLFGVVRTSFIAARAGRVEANEPPSRRLAGVEEAVTFVALSRDGSRIAAGVEDGSLRVWDASTVRPILALTEPGGLVVAIALNHDGTRVAASGWAGVRVRRDFSPNGIHGAAEGRTIITRRGAVLKQWDVGAGKVIHTFTDIPPLTRAVAFSKDGGLLGALDDSDAFTTWRTSTGERYLSSNLLKRDHQNIGSVFLASFSGDGLRAVSVNRLGPPGRINYWDAKNTRAKHVDCESEAIDSLAMSSDGHYIASHGHGQRITIRDAASGFRVGQLQGGVDGSPIVLAFSPNGRRVAAGGSDGVVRVWSVSGGRLLATAESPEKNGVRQLVFAADGLRVASGGSRHASERDSKTGRLKVTPLVVWDLQLKN